MMDRGSAIRAVEMGGRGPSQPTEHGTLNGQLEELVQAMADAQRRADDLVGRLGVPMAAAAKDQATAKMTEQNATTRVQCLWRSCWSGSKAMIRVVLQPEQVVVDDQDALRDEQRADENGWQGTHGFGPSEQRSPKKRLADRIVSYRGERAFAVLAGVPFWERDPDGFGKPDVMGWCIRTTLQPYRGLRIDARDRRHPGTRWALVWPSKGDPLAFYVVGWVTLPEFEQAILTGAAWSWDERYPERKGIDEAWILDAEHLHPFIVLPAFHLATDFQA